MARYTFAKFGSSGGTAPDPYNTPLPEIEGDCEESEHYWWTEVWSCNFDLKAAEQAKAGEDEKDEKKKPKPKPGNVTLTKKVDWGSADFFQKCCEAPEALKKKSDEEQAVGRIDEVTVEVCRKSGIESEGNIPFLVITYKKVCVISYAIDISGAEPIETLGFKYEEAEFKYVATDPYTGGRKQGGAMTAKGIVRHETPSSAAGQGTPAAAVPGMAATAAVSMGVAALATGAAGGNALPAGGASSADAAVTANFPGYLSVTGNGVLPD